MRGYSFQLYCPGNSFMQNFVTLCFETRLGGEIYSSDVNMHKGYLTHSSHTTKLKLKRYILFET